MYTNKDATICFCKDCNEDQKEQYIGCMDLNNNQEICKTNAQNVDLHCKRYCNQVWNWLYSKDLYKRSNDIKKIDVDYFNKICGMKSPVYSPSFNIHTLIYTISLSILSLILLYFFCQIKKFNPVQTIMIITFVTVILVSICTYLSIDTAGKKFCIGDYKKNKKSSCISKITNIELPQERCRTRF